MIAIFNLFLITDLHFLIHAEIPQIINTNTKVVISIGIPTNEASSDETQPLSAAMKIRKCSK